MSSLGACESLGPITSVGNPKNVAWITGGGTGIGRALGEALARRSYCVALSGRRSEVLREAAAAVRTTTGNAQVEAFECDVTRPESVATAAAGIEARWGAVTLLVNNAGVNSGRPLDAAPAQEFEALFRVNCLGAVHTLERVLPEMKRRRAGTVVNVSSILGQVASSDSAAYTVSKFALTGLNETLHQGLMGTGVHIVGVYPGYIRTAMSDPFVKAGSLKWRMGKTPEQLAAVILKALQKGRRDVYYPWYVSWALSLHHGCPQWTDRLARSLRGRGEQRP